MEGDGPLDMWVPLAIKDITNTLIWTQKRTGIQYITFKIGRMCSWKLTLIIIGLSRSEPAEVSGLSSRAAQCREYCSSQTMRLQKHRSIWPDQLSLRVRFGE